MSRRHRSSLLLGFLLSLVVAAPVAAAPVGIARSAGGALPLPACRYDDVRTRYDRPPRWRKSLLDTIYKLPRSYEPGSLASTSRAGLNGGYLIRSSVVDDLSALARAARHAGASVAVQSAYRSYAAQKSTFQYWVDQVGYQRALEVSARAGHSEHQLGTTIDFRSASSTRAPWDYDDRATTAPGRWMKRNAWHYGFLMSYPKGKRSESCYSYEPWHYRYVARDTAAAVRERRVTLRRYLWETWETAPS